MKTTGHLLRITAAFLFAARSLAASDAELKVGDAAPDFLGRDVQGQEIRLTSYAGKVIIVSFFASWCAPCRQELPMLESLQRSGADKGVQVIAVDWKEDKQIFRKLVKLNPGYQLKFVSDPRGGAGNRYGVKAIPHMFLIGRDGKVVFANVGYGKSVIDRLVPEVNRVLNMQAGAPAEASPRPSALPGTPSP